MNSNKMDDQNYEKINLNASDDEDDVKYEDFRIRPQFLGPHGQELLELSSKLPERFKLDERFAEFLGPEDLQEPEAKDDINEEKEKNIRILQSVLGHEVSKSVEKNKSVKRQIRFDPDDEKTSHLVKTLETPAEKAKKSKKKKKVVEEKVEQIVPVSTERYVEVCSNLKEVLSSASPFSFCQQFNHDAEEAVEISQISHEKSAESREKINIFDIKKNEKTDIQKQSKDLSSQQILPKTKGGVFLFFVKEGDPRLKEGIDFFKRPKPLNEIREEWQKKRERVLELFRRKKRSSQRSHSTRVQSMQNKFTMRRQNLKK